MKSLSLPTSLTSGLVSLAAAGTSEAGMTVLTFSDLAAARLEVLSFFVVCYLVLAWVVKKLWNHLRQFFTSLPEISYRGALSLMLVSGLLLYVVLTMISGARELMTPGAWQKNGIGYQLRDEMPDSDKPARERALETLKQELWKYAAEHDGTLPASVFDPGFDRSHWAHAASGSNYCYLPPLPGLPGRQVLAYEPGGVGPKRYILFSDGSIELWNESQLRETLIR